MTLKIPFPPSVNHIWRSTVVGKKVLVYMSKEGKEYRRRVVLSVIEQTTRNGSNRTKMDGRLSLTLTLHPQDRRHFDLDNKIKAVQDALQAAGVFIDDSQIDELHVYRGEVQKDPCVEVSVSPVLTDRAQPCVKQPTSAKRRAGERVF